MKTIYFIKSVSVRIHIKRIVSAYYFNIHAFHGIAPFKHFSAYFISAYRSFGVYNKILPAVDYFILRGIEYIAVSDEFYRIVFAGFQIFKRIIAVDIRCRHKLSVVIYNYPHAHKSRRIITDFPV